MIGSSAKKAFVCFLFVGAACSCAPSGSSNNSNIAANASNVSSARTAANENSDELALVVKLPFEPEESAWIEDYVTREGSAPQKRLRAVILFLPKEIDSIIAEATRSDQASTTSIKVEDWFPNELRSKSEMEAKDELDALSYNAAQFFQEPYAAGKFSRIVGTDYIFLELTSP